MMMPLGVLRMLMERLPCRMSETRMMMAEAASVPHLREPRKWWREAQRNARPTGGQKPPAPPHVLRKLGIDA